MKPLSLRVSENVTNGECDTMVDVTLIRPLNKVKVYRRDSRLFLEREQNMAIEAFCPRTSYLEQSTCWAASSRRVPRFLMANVTQWLNDLDTTSKQTSRSFVLVPIDFSYTTSYRLSTGPSNLIVCSRTHRLSTIHWRQRQTATDATLL